MQQDRHRLHRQRTTPTHHKYQEQIAALCPIGQYKCRRGRTEALVVQWTFNCQVSPELWGAVATNSCILTLWWWVAACKVCRWPFALSLQPKNPVNGEGVRPKFIISPPRKIPASLTNLFQKQCGESIQNYITIAWICSRRLEKK